MRAAGVLARHMSGMGCDVAALAGAAQQLLPLLHTLVGTVTAATATAANGADSRSRQSTPSRVSGASHHSLALHPPPSVAGLTPEVQQQCLELADICATTLTLYPAAPFFLQPAASLALSGLLACSPSLHDPAHCTSIVAVLGASMAIETPGWAVTQMLGQCTEGQLDAVVSAATARAGRDPRLRDQLVALAAVAEKEAWGEEGEEEEEA